MKSNEKILEEILFYLSGNRLSTMPNIYLRAALTAMDKVQSTPSPSRGFTLYQMFEAIEWGANFVKNNEASPRYHEKETYITSLPQTSKVEGEEWVSVAKILTWVATVFDISDGDYYWKGDADGDQPLNGKEVFEISMLPEYQEIISQIK